MTVTSIPSAGQALSPADLELLRRAADGRLPLSSAEPRIEGLYDAGLLRPHGGCWDLARGVHLCEVCGRPGEGRECRACFLAADHDFNRSQDI